MPNIPRIVATSTATILFLSVAAFAAADDTDTLPDEAQSAVERWADDYGVYRSDASVDVQTYSSELGEVTVTSTDDVQVLSNTASVDKRGHRAELAGTYRTVDIDPVLAHASAGSAWTLSGDSCQSREQNSTGWIDGCYQIYKLSSGGSAGYDYWTWKHWATAKAKGVWILDTARINSSRNSSSAGAWSWVDWSPKEDTDHNGCSTTTVGIAYVVELAQSYTQCDKWDITKYSDAGKFQNQWLGGAFQSERSVAYMTTIKTPTGKKPVWTFDNAFYSH